LTAKNRSPITLVWDFFCSLKLTIMTLILLAVTSIIGTIIQQNLPQQEYRRQFSETTYRILDSLQFFDMYHSWWFLALLGIFSLNLISCSVKRLPRVWKTVKEPVLIPTDGLYRTLSNIDEVVTAEPLEQVRDKMVRFLGKSFGKPVVSQEGDRVHLYAQKGAYARFGVYVTHCSILIIFIGAILGSLFGFKAFVNIVEGTQTNEIWPRGGDQPLKLDFAVRCEDFSLTYYEGTMRPKEFKSILTVIDNGKPVIENRPIIVNDPLTYKGITFYQSSYGPAGDPMFLFRVRQAGSSQPVTLSARQGQRVNLPGGGAFQVVDFAENVQNLGPGARLEVMSPDGQRKSFVVMQQFPDFDARRGGQYVFSLLKFEQRFYTGLQVAKDPGVWVVWLGCAMMVLGTLIAFFLSHRRIWVTIQPHEGKTGVKIGGSAHRNQPAFELFFEELKKKFKAEFTS